MIEIQTNLIKEAVYKLCFNANTCLNKEVYNSIFSEYENSKNIETKNLLKTILKNAKMAYENKMPLCQDTGQVIIFLNIGQDIIIKGEYIENAINKAVEKCYKDNFFRKSVVKNALFDRTNTNTNTPAIIYTKIVPGNEIHIKLLIKGAGSENKSKLEMCLPTIDEAELVEKIGNLIISTGINACPPMFIGIGVGYSADGAMLLSKKALISDSFNPNEINLARKIKDYVNNKAPNTYSNCYVLDVKLLSEATHIACMPVGITINCHSDRYSACTIKENKIIYPSQLPDFCDFDEKENTLREIFVNNTEEIKLLQKGEKVLLTGELYVARDMAHKKLYELIKKNEKLPINLQNSVILYAGPCPAKPNEVIGSIGPTTASRMDKYAPIMYENGVLATIGKGDRSIEVQEFIKKFGCKYFSLQGGVAAYLSKRVLKSEIVAFDELGTEAVYKIYVDKLPVTVEIS